MAWMNTTQPRTTTVLQIWQSDPNVPMVSLSWHNQIVLLTDDECWTVRANFSPSRGFLTRCRLLRCCEISQCLAESNSVCPYPLYICIHQKCHLETKRYLLNDFLHQFHVTKRNQLVWPRKWSWQNSVMLPPPDWLRSRMRDFCRHLIGYYCTCARFDWQTGSVYLELQYVI